MKSKLIVLPLALALIGAGCFGSSPTGSPGSVAMPGSRSGGCANPYYPFKVGSKITYKMTSTGNNSTYTAEVKPSTDQGEHVLVYTFMVRGQAFPLTQAFTCDGGSISAKGQFDMGAAFGAPISYETTAVEGPFMPPTLTPGLKWETTYSAILHTTNPTMARLMDGKKQSTVIKSEVVGEESVTVPAGTYRAMKVKMDITITSEAFPTPNRLTTESWFVKDIGLVKSINRGPSVSTIEATAVSGF